MNHLTSPKLAELRQHDLRDDANRVRTAPELGRGRRRRLADRRAGIARRGRRRWLRRRARPGAATTLPVGRPDPSDELVRQERRPAGDRSGAAATNPAEPRPEPAAPWERRDRSQPVWTR